jgi:general secretion pathway protein J
MSTHRARGFTLVEVLVALSIMAVLATMAWQGVDGIVRARDISQATMERTLRLNTVIAQWDQDLKSVYDSAVVPALAFDGATVRLARTAPGGVQMVAWQLQGSQWRRWAGPVVTDVASLQDSWLRSQQLLGDEPGQLLLLDNVTEVQLYFYRGNGWSNAQSTADKIEAPAGTASGVVEVAQEALPSGVRLQLNIASGVLTRDIMLGGQGY